MSGLQPSDLFLVTLGDSNSKNWSRSMIGLIGGWLGLPLALGSVRGLGFRIPVIRSLTRLRASRVWWVYDSYFMVENRGSYLLWPVGISS